MKIALLTLPMITNYGGILQAYALQKVLSQMGHDAVHLQPVEYKPLHPMWKLPFVWVKRFLHKYFIGEYPLPIFKNPYKWMRLYTDTFINKYINCDRLDDGDWNEMLAVRYDAFVVGSDQVWRLAYASPIERYFLSFLNNRNVNRIAYSASFGVADCEYTSAQLSLCAPLLQRFTSVSVREASAVEICRDAFGVRASHTLDPTLLLQKEEYLKLTTTTPKSKGDLLVYILDETVESDRFINTFAEKNKLLPFRANSKIENPNAKISERQQPPLEQWLQGFNDAKCVITDSFHACVFSIIFNKPFLCIGNKRRGMARFASLLGMFGLEHCIVSLDAPVVIPVIDWDKVNAILNRERQKSIAFLREALNVTNNDKG